MQGDFFLKINKRADQNKAVQGEFFLKINKRADQNKAVNIGWNKRAGEFFFSKSINMQTKIRPCRGDFFLKINKRACTSIRYTRVVYDRNLRNHYFGTP